MSTEMDQQQQQPKQQQIEWRRNRVLELSSQGRTEREIATILQVGAGTDYTRLLQIKPGVKNGLGYC